jgi:hypothetical protein
MNKLCLKLAFLIPRFLQLVYTNKATQEHSKIYLSKIGGLHYEFHLKPNMLIELCVDNYCTNDGFVNDVKGFFKTITQPHSTFEI